ncbi:hypothetical protein ACQY0O_007750 [Thecaphora frezii]
MAPGQRRPPPDRESILSSIGLPPRGDIPLPASPTYAPARPQASRRSRTDSSSRRSDRSYGYGGRDNHPPPLPGFRYHSGTVPHRGDRRARDYDRVNQPPRSRQESFSSRGVGDDRSHTGGSRRPALPQAYVEDGYARERDRERRDRDPYGESAGSRRYRPDASASSRDARRRKGDREEPMYSRSTDRRRERDQTRDRERPAMQLDYGEAPAREFTKIWGSRGRDYDGYRDLEPYEDLQEPMVVRSRSRSVPGGRSGRVNGAFSNREERFDEATNDEPKASSKRRSVLSRMLPGGGQLPPGPPPSQRLTRYNTLKRTDSVDYVDAAIIDEEEEERLAKETLSLVGGSRRSRAFDESDPRWLKGDVPRYFERNDVKQQMSDGKQGAYIRPRKGRQDVLRPAETSRNGATLGGEKRLSPKASAPAAAAAAGTASDLVATKAVEAGSRSDAESDSDVSSDDSDLLQDALEAPDVHDEVAISSVVTGKAVPAGVTTSAVAVAAAATSEAETSEGEFSEEVSSEEESSEEESSEEESSEEESSEEESSEEESSEEDSSEEEAGQEGPNKVDSNEEEESSEAESSSSEKEGDVTTTVPPPTPRPKDRTAAAARCSANGASRQGAAPAIAGALAPLPAAATADRAAASSSKETDSSSGDKHLDGTEGHGSSSEASSSSTVDAEEYDAPVIAPAMAPASQSKAHQAPAIIASTGTAGAADALATAAIQGRKSQEFRQRAVREADLAAKREQEAARERQREAEAARLRAEKANRRDEKLKVQEAAAVKVKGAKKEEKERLKQAKQQKRLQAREAKNAAHERKQQQKSEDRDRVISAKEEAEAQKLTAMRAVQRPEEEKREAWRQSRRRPAGVTRAQSVPQLTPQQRHYLLKALVMLQMQSEWAELEKLGALTEYGYPFSSTCSRLTRIKTFDRSENGDFANSARDPYANEDMMRETENLREPLILRHLFHVHLRSFPGLEGAPVKYWQKRIQPFFDEMAARNFSSSLERGEISKRRLYSYALTRYLGSFFARGIGVRGEGALRGPGIGEPGSERWGVGKQWGQGTVKRGLDKPVRIEPGLMQRIDNLFKGEGGRLWRQAGKDWSKVRRDWCGFKESIIESETGLEEAVSYLDVSSIKNLPPHYRNSVEFARTHAAYIFHALFVTAPNADELYNLVKGVHALAPYWGARQLLKYANAETMISGILSMLLARPGGTKSLIQRIFSYVIGKDASHIQKEFVNPIRKEIDDAELSRKVEEYVKRGDRIEARRTRETSIQRGEDILTTILLAPTEPRLSQEACDHVLELQRCFALSPYRGNLAYAYPETTPLGVGKPPMPSWGAQGAEHGRARKFALLKLLLRESLKRRDREQAVELASGSLIPAIIKDSLETVFYPAIRTIAATANLSERLHDLQKFIDDLLETKKRKDDSIEAWIALAARHEQTLYFLFHECASISRPLWDWAQLGLDYMALSTSDPTNPADRSVPHLEVNFEELLRDARLSEGDVKKVLAEVDRLATYTKWSKVRYEIEARKNYLLARREAASPSGLCESELPDEALKRELRDVDGMMRDLLEEEGEALDDGRCHDGVRGTEKYDFPWAFYDAMDPLNQHLPAEAEAGELSVSRVPVDVAPPSLKHTRKVLPMFCEVLASKMPEWQAEDRVADLAGGKRGEGVERTVKRERTTSFDARAKGGKTKSLMSQPGSVGRMKVPFWKR